MAADDSIATAEIEGRLSALEAASDPFVAGAVRALLNRVAALEGAARRAEADNEEPIGEEWNEGDIVDVNGFTGKAKTSGVAYTTGLMSNKAKRYIKLDLTTATPTFTEETGPEPSVWPSGEVWYEKANIHGNLIVPRI